MAKEADLRICKTEVGLLTECEQLHMIEGAVVGGVCSVYKMRKFTANYNYLPDYDNSQPSTFGFCVEANILYVGVMQNEKPPQAEFTTLRFYVREILTVLMIILSVASWKLTYIIQQVYSITNRTSPSKNIVEDDWLSD